MWGFHGKLSELLPERLLLIKLASEIRKNEPDLFLKSDPNPNQTQIFEVHTFDRNTNTTNTRQNQTIVGILKWIQL